MTKVFRIMKVRDKYLVQNQVSAGGWSWTPNHDEYRTLLDAITCIEAYTPPTPPTYFYPPDYVEVDK